MEVNVKHIERWVVALRSGQYKQSKHALQGFDNGYCCLGVACKLFIPEEKQEKTETTNWLKGVLVHHQKNAPSWLKDINEDFFGKTGQLLSEINDYNFTIYDYNGKTHVEIFNFDEIADMLELVYIHKAFDNV